MPRHYQASFAEEGFPRKRRAPWQTICFTTSKCPQPVGTNQKNDCSTYHAQSFTQTAIQACNPILCCQGSFSVSQSEDYVSALGVQLWISCMGRHPSLRFRYNIRHSIPNQAISSMMSYRSVFVCEVSMYLHPATLTGGVL